jgi:hypothetical protein
MGLTQDGDTLRTFFSVVENSGYIRDFDVRIKRGDSRGERVGVLVMRVPEI